MFHLQSESCYSTDNKRIKEALKNINIAEKLAIFRQHISFLSPNVNLFYLLKKLLSLLTVRDLTRTDLQNQNVENVMLPDFSPHIQLASLHARRRRMPTNTHERCQLPQLVEALCMVILKHTLPFVGNSWGCRCEINSAPLLKLDNNI